MQKEAETKVTNYKQGVVVSDKMAQTITVKLERREKHPLYGKIITKSSKVHAHDPEGKAGMGDVVRIKSCRPLSKTKSWELVDIIAKSSELG